LVNDRGGKYAGVLLPINVRMNISQKGASTCVRKMTQVTGLIIQHTILSVGAMTLVTPKAVVTVKVLREVLFAVGPYF
jgi:hypothetical protein